MRIVLVPSGNIHETESRINDFEIFLLCVGYYLIVNLSLRIIKESQV